jgi:hypothetical protein
MALVLVVLVVLVVVALVGKGMSRELVEQRILEAVVVVADMVLVMRLAVLAAVE